MNNILRVFSANLLTVIGGIIMGFILPMVLSLDGYAYVKTYMLYAGYIGFLHFGFVDGMYIKYGGKSVEEIHKGILKAEHTVFNIMQLIGTIFFLFLATITKDFVIFVLALSIIPINTSAFHRFFYQATGQFKRFANISYIYTLIYLGVNIALAFIFKSSNYKLYCYASLIGYIASFIILEYKFLKEFKGVKSVYSKEIVNNIKVGFIVLMANLAIVIFNATDLWFIKFNFNDNEFAYYSFAVSMLNIINIMINSISITFYNYLAKGEDKELIKKLKINFVVIGSFFSLAYFAFAMIVNLFLEKYIPSLRIIAVSFAGFPYIITISGLFINLYRARKDEKKYLRVMISMVVISIIYNLIAIIIFKTAVSVAVATLMAFITWYIYSGYDFRYLKINKKEIIYLLVMTNSFLILSNYFNWFIGGVVYLTLFSIISFVFYRDNIMEFIKLKK